MRARVIDIKETSVSGMYYVKTEGFSFTCIDKTGMTWVNRYYYIGKEVSKIDGRYVFIN